MLVSLPLMAPIFFLGLSGITSFANAAILLLGPVCLLAGIWAAFPTSSPKSRLRISDDEITMETPQKIIRLSEIEKIKHHMPGLSKHYRLTFYTAEEEIPLELIHLTHDGRDIINLVGVRLEKQGKYLSQGRTAVMGALTGVWEVQSGAPFVSDPEHDTLRHGRE